MSFFHCFHLFSFVFVFLFLHVSSFFSFSFSFLGCSKSDFFFWPRLLALKSNREQTLEVVGHFLFYVDTCDMCLDHDPCGPNTNGEGHRSKSCAGVEKPIPELGLPRPVSHHVFQRVRRQKIRPSMNFTGSSATGSSKLQRFESTVPFFRILGVRAASAHGLQVSYSRSSVLRRHSGFHVLLGTCGSILTESPPTLGSCPVVSPVASCLCPGERGWEVEGRERGEEGEGARFLVVN